VAYSPALGAPLARPLPHVAHVHDLIPLHADSQFSGAAGWYWRTLLPYTWKRCTVLTVSNHTVADEIAERLGYARERIHVVPYYPDPQVAAAAAQLKPGYAQIGTDDAPDTPLFLTLASHEPRKNLDKAILALAVLRDEGIEARLKLIGGHTPLTDGLRRLAEDYGVAGQVELPGYMGRADAVRELLGCTALLFISREEGYGMPPQEAQSIGVATVLSDIPCLRAVYADEARLSQLPRQLQLAPAFVPVDDPTLLALEMKRLIADGKYRQRLRQAGLAYSATFSPRATALALDAAFKAALG
jgi:glycosyltransferase involved in cell wall biosynthesis